MSKNSGRGGRISMASLGALAGATGVFADMEVEAGIISLSATPTTISFGSAAYVTLQPLNAAFLQFNDPIGKSLYGNNGFAWANVTQGQRIDKNLNFTSKLTLGSSAAGDRLFAFRQGNHYGWIKENLGGSGGAITFLSGAYNDGIDLNNDFIDAGTLNGSGGGSFAAVPEPGTTGLMGLAALAAGATAVRRRRAAAVAASAGAV